MDLDPELPEMVAGDPIRVRQVLGNLLSNAIKFTATGEIRVTVRPIATAGELTWVRFEVSDSGIGIEPQQLERVFGRFTQADDSTTRRFGGTGLGLAIVRQLVQMMDGEVGVESVVGEGSQFWFTLPLGDHRQLHGGDTAYPEFADTRLLVVGEDEETCGLIATLGRGWQMQDDHGGWRRSPGVPAGGGGHRADSLRRHRPGDDRQPRVVAAILRDARFTTPAIMTLTSCHEQRQRSRDAGIHAFTTKPVRRARLGSALTRRCATAGAGSTSQLGRAGDEMVPIPMILVAEDNEVNQILAAHMLSRRGYRTEVVGNGTQALAALSQRPFAAVLMDCQMPELSGYDATSRLRLRELGVSTRR